MSLNALNASEVDHYTPLSRAVASIDRDAYAARFAIYDRAHKALLRRLATATSPPSAADVEREEQAFRDAVRRIEFADELAEEQPAEQSDAEFDEESPALVPQREPVGAEPLQELRREAPWPEVRPRRERDDMPPSMPDYAANEPDIALASLQVGPRRSVIRRVGERLMIAVFVLALGGVWLWVADARQQATDVTPASTVTNDAEAPDSPPAEAAKAPGPGWLSAPELFYTAPSFPTASPPAAAAARPAQAPHRP